MNISNGVITAIVEEMGNRFLTVEYGQNEVIRLLVDERTILLGNNCSEAAWVDLKEGTIIDAKVSDTMTRSIPPQATAYLIRIMREAMPEVPPVMEAVTMGRIWNVNRNNRSFETITGQDFSTLTRFNVPDEAKILNRSGKTIGFSDLMIGMRVKVTHEDFMTASIPPQTTALEVQVL